MSITLSGSDNVVYQVISVTKTDAFTTTSSTFTDITGLSVSITPKFATSKIMVFVTTYIGNQASVNNTGIRLMRDSTAICIGTDATGSQINSSGSGYSSDDNNTVAAAVSYLDSPATTSATTYKLQVRTNTGTAYINEPYNWGSNVDYVYRVASTITVMEIAA